MKCYVSDIKIIGEVNKEKVMYLLYQETNPPLGFYHFCFERWWRNI